MGPDLSRRPSQLSVFLLQVYSSLSEGEFQLLRQTLLIFFQDMNVRVSSARAAVGPGRSGAPPLSANSCILLISGVAVPQKSSAESKRPLRHAAIRPGASWDRCPRTHQVSSWEIRQPQHQTVKTVINLFVQAL